MDQVGNLDGWDCLSSLIGTSGQFFYYDLNGSEDVKKLLEKNGGGSNNHFDHDPFYGVQEGQSSQHVIAPTTSTVDFRSSVFKSLCCLMILDG